jgi:hypothetical protein
MTLDQAREAAIEAGYLRDNGADAGRESTTDVRTLLDAIDRELRGQKVYREGHERASASMPTRRRITRNSTPRRSRNFVTSSPRRALIRKPCLTRRSPVC